MHYRHSPQAQRREQTPILFLRHAREAASLCSLWASYCILYDEVCASLTHMPPYSMVSLSLRRRLVLSHTHASILHGLTISQTSARPLSHTCLHTPWSHYLSDVGSWRHRRRP